MSKLGSAQTSEFSIGTVEVRLGPLASALQLAQSSSIGLVDDATIRINQDSVDLEGGFPRAIVATEIVRQAATVEATPREYSRRNLNIMLGNGVAASNPADVKSLVVNNAALGASSVTVTAAQGALFSAGDVVVIYPAGRPEDVSVLEIASVSVDSLTFVTGQVTLAAYDGTSETIHIYKAFELAVGNVTQVNYFTATLIQRAGNTGRPRSYNFWKAASAGSLDFATNAEDFATMNMELKILEPAAADYGVGGPLEHVANLIPANPAGFLALGGLT